MFSHTPTKRLGHCELGSEVKLQGVPVKLVFRQVEGEFGLLFYENNTETWRIKASLGHEVE
jgi:hypothetical protein